MQLENDFILTDRRLIDNSFFFKRWYILIILIIMCILMYGLLKGLIVHSKSSLFMFSFWSMFIMIKCHSDSSVKIKKFMKITLLYLHYFVLFHLLYFVFFKKQAFLGRLLVNINKDGDGDIFFVIC